MTLHIEERALVERARRFADEVLVPAAEICERERRWDPDVLREAAALGLTRIQVAPEKGGLGLSFACKSQVAEVLARACFGFSMSIINTQNTAWRLSRIENDYVRPMVGPMLSGDATGCAALTEPSAGSDFAAIRTTARRRADGAWVLNGEKRWISNARHASYAITFAQTKEHGDASGVGAFVVEAAKPGFERVDNSQTFALHANGMGGFRMTDYVAPPEAVVMEPGVAFRQILSEINGARIYVAAMCLGMIDAALDATHEFGRRRETFGKPLRDHQGWRWKLAQAEVDLAAARALVRQAEAAHSAGEDTQLIAAQAKIVGVGLANRHIPELLHAHGAAGLSAGTLFSRHLAGMQAASFADGSTEIMLERVSRLARPHAGRALAAQ